MERFELSKSGKRILLALYRGEYPSQVPDEDYADFNLLEVQGLVHAVKTKGNNRSELHASRITDLGRAYITSNPSLLNRKVMLDWKYWLGIIIAVVGVLATVWAAMK